MLGTSLGPYRIVEKLGTGGMGTVYLAVTEDDAPATDAGERVALKVLHPHLFAAPGSVKRVEREAAAGARVRHENVVTALGWDTVDLPSGPCCFLVTEYVEGRTLRNLLTDLGTVPEALLREIGEQVAAGLSAIHAEGMVHRDLKPENVLITADQRIRIMDLGVARHAHASEITGDGGFAGSILYAAPEQLKNRPIGPAADLYSLGVVLYELATGENPFRREDAAQVITAHLFDAPPEASDRCPELSLFLSDLIAALLSKDPGDRFGSAEDVRALLGEGEASGWWSGRERATSRRPIVPVRKQTRLFGREAELSALSDALAAATEGRGSTALLLGEAGIGKSRLIDALFAEQLPADCHVLYGSYSPSGGRGGIGGSILAHFGAADLEGALAPYLESIPVLLPSFAALVRQERLPPGSHPLDGDALHAATCELMRGLAAEKPLIWVIEDLQFADPGSREIVLSLARALEEHRVLLVLTARPELPASEIAHLSRLASFCRVSLSRLDDSLVVEMVREELGSDELAAKLGPRISEKSDGVPYFALEILRGLREDEFLSALPDGTHVETREIEKIEVPSAVRDLILGRLEQLDEEERPLLELAAVQGFEFDPDLVARVRGTERVRVLQRLAALERSTGLVRAAGRAYRFDHHLIQELVYADLPQGLREEYHTLLADAYAERARAGSPSGAEPGGESAVFLATHHLRGGRPWSAIAHLEPALDHLSNAHRNEAMIDLSGLALANPDLLMGLERLEMLLERARRLDLLGRFSEQKEALSEAMRLADDSGDPLLRARTRRLLATEANVLRDPARRCALLEEARELARAAGNAEEEAAVSGTLGSISDRLGRFEEARELHELAYVLAEGCGATEEAAKAEGNLAHVCFRIGRLDEAGARARRCRDLFREAGNPRAESATLGLLAGVEYELGRYDRARELYEEQLELSRRIGHRRGMAMAIGNLGALDRAQGRYASALDRFARDRALSREMGDVRGEAVNGGHLAGALTMLGDHTGAREYWSRSLESFRGMGDRLWEGFALLWLGIVAEHQGRPEEGERLCEQALEIWREIGARSSTADALVALGRMRLARGDREAAREALGEGLAVGREFGIGGAIVRTSAWLALLTGDAAEAEEALREHEPTLDHCEHLEARHALHRATGDASHLEAAHRLLAELREHAPLTHRETMVEAVPLLRSVHEDWERRGPRD